MSIEVRSPELLDLVDADAQAERLGSGCQFTEGPLWNAAAGYLLFSDIPANQIKRWRPDSGITNFRPPSGRSNGLTYDKQGRLIACEHGNRRVSRTEADGTIIAIAAHYNGKRLNSPNDVVVKSDGSIYFTDPPYGIMDDDGEIKGQELGFQGVYRLSADCRTLTLLADDFDGPNGLCFSPDESVLYVDDTARMHIRAFDLQLDGTLGKGRVFAEESGENGVPDGMKVDVLGNIYATGPGGVWISDPSGKHLGIIKTPEITANLAWGGGDWKSLFITASTSIYRVECKVSGIPVP